MAWASFLYWMSAWLFFTIHWGFYYSNFPGDALKIFFQCHEAHMHPQWFSLAIGSVWVIASSLVGATSGLYPMKSVSWPLRNRVPRYTCLTAYCTCPFNVSQMPQNVGAFHQLQLFPPFTPCKCLLLLHPHLTATHPWPLLVLALDTPCRN